MEGEWLCYIEVVSLMEGEWSCYRGGQFIGRRMVMLQKCSHFNGGRMDVTEVVTLMEGQWSCYGGGQFKGGRMVLLQRQPV